MRRISREATVTISPPPAVSGLGRAGGIKLMVEDRGDIGLKALQEQTDNLVRKGTEQPQLKGLLSVFNVNAPQLYFDVDRDACLSQGISLGEVFGTLQGYLGSRYVNDFNMYGRTWQVVVQADDQYRDRLEDVRKLKVRNRDGNMVPLGSVANVRTVWRPADGHSLQHVPRCGHHSQYRSRSQQRRRHSGSGRCGSAVGLNRRC